MSHSSIVIPRQTYTELAELATWYENMPSSFHPGDSFCQNVDNRIQELLSFNFAERDEGYSHIEVVDGVPIVTAIDGDNNEVLYVVKYEG